MQKNGLVLSEPHHPLPFFWSTAGTNPHPKTKLIPYLCINLTGKRKVGL